jgi:exodeoxyribonuclease-3
MPTGPLRIASWNVNGIRARLEFVAHWLRARQPDLVGLQELKAGDDEFPHAELAACGYRSLVSGQKGWNGVAVLVREGLAAEAACRGLPGQEQQGARLLTARVDAPGGELEFTSVYVPNGKDVGHEDFARKLAWLDALAAHLEARCDAGRPAVLCGDFNVVPTALDSWDEAGHAGGIFHTDEERKRFRRLLDWGLVDLFRKRHPEAAAFSWWDYRGGAFHRKHGLRIDFVLATRPLAERLTEASIDRDWRKKVAGLTPSDHAPVVAELR